jgi:serine/threonine protein kinase
MIGNERPAERPDTLLPGQMFAQRYRVERLLGDGDRKRTYLARDTKMEKLVALSLVKAEAIAHDPEGTAREARVLGTVGSHDNIVSLFDFENDPTISCQYMVFEYLSGGTLSDLLREVGPLPVDELLRLSRQLCRGLSHLHSRGILHRDVSPDNVWLDERRVAHLGDFDSAVPVDDLYVRRPLTTNSFAAPEELRGESIEVRSDLFSLGGVLYAAATGGLRPGDGRSVRALRPEIPTSFADLVASLLAESPDDRPRDTDAVFQWLDDVRNASNVQSLIAQGEGRSVEFKASLCHPIETPPTLSEPQLQEWSKNLEKELHKEAAKTIAAFLNTEGGSLLIGVANDGLAVGIESDFAHCKPQNLDGWLLHFKDVIARLLGPLIWPHVRVGAIPLPQGVVAVVSCKPSSTETWLADGHEQEKGDLDMPRERFFIRSTSSTERLAASEAAGYIRTHWAGRTD